MSEVDLDRNKCNEECTVIRKSCREGNLVIYDESASYVNCVSKSVSVDTAYGWIFEVLMSMTFWGSRRLLWLDGEER